MPYAELDVSYRAPGEKIPVLYLPKDHREVQGMMKDSPLHTPRFQLSLYGMLWFADAAISLHGDEFEGALVVPERAYRNGAGEVWEAPWIVNGVVASTREAWMVLCHSNGNLPLVLDPEHESMPAAQKILSCYDTWDRVVRGVELKWWHELSLDEQLSLRRGLPDEAFE